MNTQLQRRIAADAEAQVVAELETSQRRTVTTYEIADIIGAAPAGQRVRDVVALLRRHGWLRPLPLRGAYEFEPAVGGPFPSGNPWLELTVALQRNPRAQAHVGLGSAAFVRRLADRRPIPDTIVWVADQPVPPGLRDVYRVVRSTADRFFGMSLVDSVPVATVERIALEVALWWKYAGDLRNKEHWLRNVLQHANPDTLSAGARQLGPTVTGRLGYLAKIFEANTIESALAPLPHTGPIWLGPRSSPVKLYDRVWGVYDTIGVATSS
jgi:predicted transcriptional regulator of viral defense system